MKQSGVNLVSKMMKQSCSGLVASRGRADLTTSISAIEPTERRSMAVTRLGKKGRSWGGVTALRPTGGDAQIEA
jgi:hypothetical protein